ncbi:MAG: zinc-ribbon domain-containing protein [Alphaproteobacteria bacterium]|nr:zinc-ribbon domain-containing protein [Alphaproteobacteria bacterium]
MKLTCPFCRTEYSINRQRSSSGHRVVCVCCGHVWVPSRKASGGFLLWIAAVCLVLSAAVFIGAAVVKYWPAERSASQVFASLSPLRNHTTRTPLAIEMAPVRIVSAEMGETHWIVSGIIKNNSTKLHGIPDLIMSMRNNDGVVIATQKIIPPTPVLDIGESIGFEHQITPPASDVKQIRVEFSR